MQPRHERIWFYTSDSIMPGRLDVGVFGDYTISDDGETWSMSNTRSADRLASESALPLNCFHSEAEAHTALVASLDHEIARLTEIRARLAH